MSPNLSYILTTRNKLPYLTKTVEELLTHKQQDEEILISDGASTDGTKEYLEALKKNGKIDFFISEPDKGEADGYNKLLTLARGTLIKVVTDDDVIYYPGVQACKIFMLKHNGIDFLNTNGIKRRKSGSTYPSGPLMYQGAYEQWQKKHTPFASCGIGIMIRRSSLPILGVFDPSFVRTDAEYTFRVTASKANIAWYTQECYAHILNPRSNTSTQSAKYFADTDRLNSLYLGESKNIFQSSWNKVKRTLKNTFFSMDKAADGAFTYDEWLHMFISSQSWLQENAEHSSGEFLYTK